ncbi:ABC transporter ATP-binding protein [Paenibacillus periandrae]|uniref:ABC transporter ATP-binding protein n=1 Tax=Paenibacillus periandrae TaxID=1761741 RepID=UPI0023DD9D5A|nr:ABC transporter ATP-binding protein [Paenibacillus periandrae]
MGSVKWLLQTVDRLVSRYLFAVCLLSMETLTFLSTIYLQKYIVDGIFDNTPYTQVLLTIFFLVVAYILYSIFYVVGPFKCAKDETRLRNILSTKMMENIFNLPSKEFQKKRTATMVEYFTNDITQASKLIAFQIPRATQQMIMVAALVLVIGFTSAKILLFSLIISVIYIVLGKYTSGKMLLVSREVQSNKSRMNVSIEESIASLRETVTYNRQQWAIDRIQRLFNKYFKSVIREGWMENRSFLISDPLKWISNLMVLGYGGYLTYQDELTLGTFVVLYQLISQFTGTLHSAYQLIMDIAGKAAHLHRMQENFGSEHENQYQGDKEFPEKARTLRFKNVSFAYEGGSRMHLCNLNIEIPLGKKIAIVGTSGSGKSTIAQLLIRHIEPSSGQIMLDDVPINEIRNESWTQKVSMVFQEPFFFPDTIRTNLMVGLKNVHDARLREACEIAQIYNFIGTLKDGFNEIIGERGVTLSGGQRQRLAIVRAILKNPDILILDEATSALDSETEEQLQRNIDELRRGGTTIVIAHRLSTIVNSDLILFLESGEIVESGTHEQLLTCNSRYRKLVEIQMNGDSEIRSLMVQKEII